MKDKKSTHSVATLLAHARNSSRANHLDESAQSYEQIIALEPDNTTAHFELGVVVLNQGNYQSAIEHLQKAVELDERQPIFHNRLGIAYSAAGNLSAGARCFEKSLELAPGDAATHYNLAINYYDQGRPAEAVDQCQKAIEANSNYAAAYILLGKILRQQDQRSAATDVYRTALAACTSNITIQFNLAVTLYEMGQYREAATLFQAVATSQPAHEGVHSYLGSTLAHLGQFDDAVKSHKKAIEREPNSALAHYSLAQALLLQNDLAGSIAGYRAALAIKPDYPRARSGLLTILHYLPNKSQEELYEESLQFESQSASGILQIRPTFSNSKDENKRLKIGYVSPDFREHSVALFTKKLISAHDTDQVEVFCYANINAANEDHVTDEFRAQADHWESIFGSDDKDVVERIKRQQLDILVDLAGHSAHNRLLMFAHRPAPIQISWLGYPNTTGLACMDYRLTDSIADPPGAVDQWYTEELVRLPDGFLCYQPAEPSPDIAASPHLERGYITYGSFNNPLKITHDVVRIWSEILKRTPDARLILKSGMFAHQEVRTQFFQQFSEQGVASDRLELLGHTQGREQHLEIYSRIDIGLDPFPYNGTATTCEALWMGVPVVSLLGDRHSSRVGASIMHHIGLPELIADHQEAYVDVACKLAADSHQLARYRQMLRPQMSESPFMDVQGFTRSLEDSYRWMWKAWCANHY